MTRFDRLIVVNCLTEALGRVRAAIATIGAEQNEARDGMNEASEALEESLDKLYNQEATDGK